MWGAIISSSKKLLSLEIFISLIPWASFFFRNIYKTLCLTPIYTNVRSLRSSIGFTYVSVSFIVRIRPTFLRHDRLLMVLFRHFLLWSLFPLSILLPPKLCSQCSASDDLLMIMFWKSFRACFLYYFQ